MRLRSDLYIIQCNSSNSLQWHISKGKDFHISVSSIYILRSLRRLCFHKRLSFSFRGRGWVAGRTYMAGGMCGGGAYVAREGHAWRGAACVAVGVRAGEMATEAGGTHPIGMHSCLINFQTRH